MKKFREICGVNSNAPWPPIEPPRINAASNDPYYTPDFDQNVEHTTNTEIFAKVASLVMSEMRVSRLELPQGSQGTHRLLE